jgi:hypothetical protein
VVARPAPSATLGVRIVDPMGEPLPGVGVTVSGGGRVHTTVTRPDGTATLAFPAEHAILKAELNGFQTFETRLLQPRGPAARLEITMALGGFDCPSGEGPCL